MNANDWSKLESIFHAALEVDVTSRRAYIMNACGGEARLGDEVLSLIAAFEEGGRFLDESPFDMGLEVIGREDRPSLVGKMIGSYEIKMRLGGGGMGEVYLARDSTLDRDVALKFLSSELFNDTWARRQFLREARAVAMLDHANICAVYEISEFEEHQFLAMQYVRGDTLAAVIRDTGVPASEFRQIALGICGAIAAAHDHGIIHRDIKPANIMITPDRHVKVLDFGLAKFLHQESPPAGGDPVQLEESRASGRGLIAGTVSYMSPEQLRGEKLDVRSDIFSLGVVLYELAASHHPFARESDAETISAILTAEPEVTSFVHSSPRNRLGKILHRCLEKRKEDRYQSVEALMKDLREVDLRRSVRFADLKMGHAKLVGVTAVIACLLGIAYILSPWHLRHQQHRLAVLPFANSTNDPELDYIGEGVSEGLINRLGRLSSAEELQIRPFTQVAGYRGPSVDPRAAGLRTDTDIVVTGSVDREGDGFRIDSTLVNVEDGSAIRTETVRFNTDSLLSVQDELSQSILSALGVSVRDPSQDPSAGSSQQNGNAYRLYLKGRNFWSRRDARNIENAILAFRQAADIDPSYAKAYSGLADSFLMQSLVAYGSAPAKESMVRAKAAAKKALEIDENDCEAHASLGAVAMKFDWDWRVAESELLRSISINPDYAPAHYWYAGLLAVTGRGPESIAEASRARELDPFSPLTEMNLARAFYYSRRYGEALEVLTRNGGSSSSDPKIRYMTGLVHLQQGAPEQALSIFQEIYQINKAFGAAPLGYTYARLGRTADAKRVLEVLTKLSSEGYVPDQEIAIVHIGLKENEKALDYLSKAFDERHGALISLKVEPLFDDLRGHNRFQQLLRSMRLDEDVRPR
jgi:eukaryotic-like serine/threonine-protein kinase